MKNYKLAPVKSLKNMYESVHGQGFPKQKADTYRSASSMWEESDGGNQALEMLSLIHI